MKMPGPTGDGAIVEALFARSEEALWALDSEQAALRVDEPEGEGTECL